MFSVKSRPTVDTMSAMFRAGDKAYRMRYWLLALLILVEVGAAGWLAYITEFDIGPIIATIVFVAAQFLFLGRRENWPVHLAKKSTPMRRTAAIGAMLATAITIGVIATLLEVPDIWTDIREILGTQRQETLTSWPTTCAFIGVIWGLWTVTFACLWPGVDRYTWLTRLVRRLIVGSILELLASIAVQAIVPDRHNCGCARGSFLGIIIGVVTLIWAFGPGVVLVFLYEKVRMERAIIDRRCGKCDYDLRGTLDAGRMECPECGTKIVPKSAG